MMWSHPGLSQPGDATRQTDVRLLAATRPNFLEFAVQAFNSTGKTNTTYVH